MSVTTSPPRILTSAPVDPETGITEPRHLVNHLLQAAHLEMSTIPLYLYAGFSIGSRGYSRWQPGTGAFRLIRSIVVEEMLHLCLVRNLLVALGHGDKVTFYDKNFIPEYPSNMLHRYPPLQLILAPCTPELAQQVFMEFERPWAKPGEGTPPHGQYATIGQFYKAVRKGLTELDAKLGPRLWSANKPSFQYTSAYWNVDGGGEPVLINDLKTAKNALKIIVEQGEGIDHAKPEVPIDPLKPVPGLNEMPHYTKFKRIADRVEPLGTVWNLPTNPHMDDYKADKALTSIGNLFNAAYCYVLHMLDVIYQTPWDDVLPGNESPRYHYERTFISAMQGILTLVAETMTATPITKGPLVDHHAAPTFEYYALPEKGKKDHLVRLCDEAMAHFPSLGGDNSVRWLIGKLPSDL